MSAAISPANAVRLGLNSASPRVLDAAVRRVPITGDIEHVTAPEGATIAEFVAIAFPAEAHRSHVVAILDGEEIAPEAWERAPRAGETLQLVFRPGGKDFFRTLLQIAVIAVSVWVGGGALGGWFAAGTWQAAVAAAGVSILGSLAINSLIPLPKPGSLETPAPYYSLSSARNSARLWSAVPMLFGRHRIVPPRMSDPVQEVIGGVTYLRLALCLGLCPMQVSDWKIGETALSSFTGVEMELRLNADDPPHTLITGDPVQDAVGATLTHTEWTTRTTATDVDEIEVIYDFPSGLGGLDSKGRKTARTVNLRLQYRPTGSSEDWTDWRPTVPQANTASSGAGVPYRPEYFEFEDDLVAWRGQLGGMSGVAGDIVPITRSDPGRAFRHSERFAVPRGQYDVRTQRTEAASTDPNIVDAVSWGVLGSIRTAADPFPNRKLATACFRIKASDQLSNMVDTLNCIAESLQPVFSEDALEHPAIADAGEFTTVATSSNPAVLALLAMRGANTAYPKPNEEVDWPSFAAAAAKFAARGLTFNEYVESDIGRWEMVNRILAAGHARAVKHNGRVSVVVDDSKAGQAPAQTFTPRNVLNFRWQKTFPRLPHAIRTPFANADNGWQADEVTVYLPGYSAETATRYETVAMPGKTDADEIRTVVNQYARNSHFQTESFEFETDVEHLTVKRGDYCVVQHHAMATGLGAARIATREVNGGGDVTAILLDADIETPVGESLAVQWRTIVVESGFARMEVIGEQAVTRDASNPRRFVFGSPQSGSTKPVARGDTYEGDIALVGIAGKVSLEVLVRDIQPRPHLRAGISCVAYAGERFVDAPTWPAHDPKVTRPYAPRPAAPADATPIASALQIAVGFTQPPMPTGVELTGYRVARRESGSAGDSWEPLGQLGPDERIAIAPAGEPGADYDIRIVAVGIRDDGVTVYSDALVASGVSAVTAPAQPAGCGGAFTTRTSSGGAQQLVLTATWTANENPDVLDTVVEQRISTGPDVWQEIGRGAAATGRTEIHGLPVGRAYVLGFTNISKRGAPSTRTVIDSITAPDTLVATGALAAVPGSALAAAIAAAGASADADAAAAAASAADAAVAQALAEAARDDATSAAGSAGTYSGEAQDARDDAVAAASVAGTHASTADADAATATAQASSATASAAAAATSATLSATYAAGSQGSINSSATFADNANATGVPTNWGNWENGSGTRVTGLAPQPYAFTLVGGAGANAGISQYRPGSLTKGFYVLEADVTLNSGALTGAGVWFDWLVSTVGTGAGLVFSTDPDVSGSAPGAGVTGRLYRFRKLVEVPGVPDNGHTTLYAMSHWSGHGSIASANSITWHRCALRPASQAEIEARQAKLDLVTANANIATNAAAAATNAASIASLSTTVSANFAAQRKGNRNLHSNPSGNGSGATAIGSGLWTGVFGGDTSGTGWEQERFDWLGGNLYYEGWSSYSSGTARAYYWDIPLTNGAYQNYTVSWIGWQSGFTSAPYVQAYILDSGGGAVAFSSAPALDNFSSGVRSSTTVGSSGGTGVTIRLYVVIPAQTVGSYCALMISQIKLEIGSSMTAFSDDTSVNNLNTGLTTTNANVAINTIAIATESASRALLETNLRASLGSGSDNLVINTDFYNGLEGWVAGWDGNSGLPVTRGFADTDSVGGTPGSYSGAVRTAYVRLTGTPAANTVVDGYTTRQWLTLSELKRWAVRVPGAVRLHASMYMSAHRGKARLIVGEFAADGTLITDANVWDGTANHNNFGSGNPANAERVGGFFTTNANTRYLVLIPRLVGVSGGNDPYLFFGWAMVAMASAQQTVAPPYVSGGQDRGLYGEVEINAGAIADVEAGAAWLEAVVSASGGDLGAFRLRAGKAGSYIELISTVLRLANITNGSVIEVMRAVGGEAYFSRPISIDFAGARMTIGPGYGVSGSELFLWVGPDTIAPSSQSRTNGAFAIGSDKKVYYGAAELVASTADKETKTGTASFDNVTTSGTTLHTMATIDLTVGASGYLELLSPLFFGPLSINQESGMTLSSGTDWFGNMIITEQLQSGGTEHTLWTIPLQISDTGGGLFDFIFDAPVTKVVAQNVSGASRYRIKLQRTSGSNNVSGNGLQGKFTIRRTP